MQLIALCLILLASAIYGILASVAFQRRRWLGALAVLSIPLFLNVIWGTFAWWRPHAEIAYISSRSQDWLCHATNIIPSSLLVALALGIVSTVGLFRFWPPARSV